MKVPCSTPFKSTSQFHEITDALNYSVVAADPADRGIVTFAS